MAKKAKGKARKNAAIKLPPGFTSIDVGGGFGAWWDFGKQKTLLGKVVGTDSYTTTQDVENKQGKTVEKEVQRRILRIQQANGVTVNVGESAALRELFDTKGIKGKQVFLQYLGQESFKTKKGKMRKINKFAVAVK